MAVSVDEAGRMALELPGVEERVRHGARTWFVVDKPFAWERGYSKADMKRFEAAGETPPEPPLLAVMTADLQDKEALLAAGHKGFFTIEHFATYPAVLIHLKVAGKRAVREALLDGWLAKAPPAMADAHLATMKKRR